MEGWTLHWCGQTNIWCLPREEIEALWVLSCSDKHHSHVFWGGALLLKMKAGVTKFPTFSKGGVQQHSPLCVRTSGGVHRAALVPLSVPSSDGNGA